MGRREEGGGESEKDNKGKMDSGGEVGSGNQKGRGGEGRRYRGREGKREETGGLQGE